MRLVWTALALAVILCVPFVIWGEEFTRWFTGDAALVWIRGWGAWGWLAVIALLMADLFLPLPGTAVMSAAGYLYGPWLGGTLSAAGSVASGMLGYGLCRSFGRGFAVRLAGEEALAENESFFRRRGPLLVAASRWLPLLPEVVTCLAGLTQMPARTFTVALLCGSVPLGFVYAAIGAAGQDHPRLALTLSVLAPPVLWALVSPWLRRGRSTPAPPEPRK